VFFKGSRYEKVETDTMTDREGRAVAFKKTRLIPDTPAELAHRVAPPERLDHIAHRYYRDAERFWRICDSNVAMWPDDLTSEPGRRIAIPRAED
jgi:hypothetical protein